MKIPLLDLAAQYGPIEEAAKKAMLSVFDSKRFILGPEVAELESRLADYCKAPHAIAVASGTDALLVSFKALGVEPGDEVITTPFTFYSTASSAVHAGAKPVFVDIDPETCLIRPELLEEAITERTRVIVPVHLFGQCADMEAIGKIASKRKVAVLEDACQAIGAETGGKRAGTIGDAGALSFYPSKNLGGIGDGGMVLTRRDDVAERVKMLRVHGASKEYHHDLIGYNSRLDTIQAAVLLAKLPLLDKWAEGRAKNAGYYGERFGGTSARPLRKLAGRHVYNNFVIRVPRRDELLEHLRSRDIGCAVYYPVPLHKLGCFAPFMEAGVSFPGAEQAAAECLAIPVYPEMTEQMLDAVASEVLGFYGEK